MALSEGKKLGRNESPELAPQVPCGARERCDGGASHTPGQPVGSPRLLQLHQAGKASVLEEGGAGHAVEFAGSEQPPSQDHDGLRRIHSGQKSVRGMVLPPLMPRTRMWDILVLGAFVPLPKLCCQEKNATNEVGREAGLAAARASSKAVGQPACEPRSCNTGPG